MSNTDFLGRAIDTVKKAIEFDNEGEYEKAYQLYYSALELFMLALKWEKNPRSKEMIRAKTGEYMERAEKLKNHLASQADRKKPSAVGANGKVAQGSGKGGYVCFFFSLHCVFLFIFFSCLSRCGFPMLMVMIATAVTTMTKTQMQRSSGAPLPVLYCRTSPT